MTNLLLLNLVSLSVLFKELSMLCTITLKIIWKQMSHLWKCFAFLGRKVLFSARHLWYLASSRGIPYRVPWWELPAFSNPGKFLGLIPQRAGSRPHDNYCPRQTVKVNMTSTCWETHSVQFSHSVVSDSLHKKVLLCTASFLFPAVVALGTLGICHR